MAYKSIISGLFIAIGMMASAETFVLTDTPVTLADWKNGAFYAGGSAPTGASTDIICTPAATMTIEVDGSDAELMSFLSGISQLVNSNATIRVNVPSGEVELGCAVWDRGSDTGLLEKTGEGQLNLTAVRKTGSTGSDVSDYLSFVQVKQGTLKLPQVFPSGSSFYVYTHKITVDKGATLITTPSYVWQPAGIEGEGLVTNAAATSVTVYCVKGGKQSHFVFSGAMGGKMAVQVRSGCIWDVISANITVSDGIVAYKNGTEVPEFRARYFGKSTDAATSIGEGADAIYLNANAPIVYTGLGETSSRDWQINYLNSIISGGTNGNLTLTGTCKKWDATKHNISIGLSGDNLYPCTFSVAINEFYRTIGGVANTLCNYYLTKSGTGEWNLPCTAQLVNSGVIAVEDGILSFGSIDRKGELTALGTSTNTVDNVSIPTEADRTDYAFLLGSDRVNACGYLECKSARAQQCTDRPFAIAGVGGFKADTALVKYAKVYGVGATGDERTLVLAGSLADESEVYDVSDYQSGAAAERRPTLSVRKEGSGTWVLGGHQTFSGALTVNGGKLIVRRAAQRYQRYRLLIMETANKNATFGKLDMARSDFHVAEIGLYAQNGERQNLNLKYNAAYAALKPGECALGLNRTVSSLASGPYNVFELMFDGYRKRFNDEEQTSASWHALQGQTYTYENGSTKLPSPIYGSPMTYVPLDMYLDDLALSIDHFDVMTSSGGNYTIPTRFQLLASVDGVHWDEVSDEVSIASIPTSNQIWLNTMAGGDCVDGGSPSTVITSQTHVHGWPITKIEPTVEYDLLSNVGEVSVASGATLEYDGDANTAPTVDSIKVDAAGAGTLKGFQLSATGTIDVQTDDGDLSVPLKLVNVTLPGTFDAWQVKVNGIAKPYKLIKTGTGQLAIDRQGLVIMFK